MPPKSTVPETSFVADVRSGIGAPSSPVTVKVNLPVMSAGPVRPSGTLRDFMPVSDMVASVGWYSFTNASPPSGYATSQVRVPSPLSVTLTVTPNVLACAVMPASASPAVASRAT